MAVLSRVVCDSFVCVPTGKAGPTEILLWVFRALSQTQTHQAQHLHHDVISNFFTHLKEAARMAYPSHTYPVQHCLRSSLQGCGVKYVWWGTSTVSSPDGEVIKTARCWLCHAV